MFTDEQIYQLGREDYAKGINRIPTSQISAIRLTTAKMPGTAAIWMRGWDDAKAEAERSQK